LAHERESTGDAVQRTNRLIIAAMAVIMSACAGSDGVQRAPGGGRDVMELDLHLTRTDLVIGEDTPLTLVLKNATGAALTIPDPELNRSLPQMRLRDLQTNTQKNFGPIAAPANEFAPPLPEPDIDLPAGQERRIESTLMKRALIERAGDYELSAYFRWATGETTSKPVALAVRPLDLQSASFVGAHGGPSPYRYCLWSHADTGGSVLLWTGTTFGQHGDPSTTQSVRLTRVDGEAHPVLSTSRNGAPFPGQWAVWLDGSRLQGLYIMHGSVRVTGKPVELGVSDAVIIPPVLSVPDDADASVPARGEVGLWSADGGANKLTIRFLEPDGSVTRGWDCGFGRGDLKWSRALALKDSERRFLVAIERGADIVLQMVRWDGGTPPAAPDSLFRWQGNAIAAGATLNNNDTTLGATLLAVQTTNYQMRPWRIESDGKATEGAPIAITLPRDVTIDRAIVELSPEGNIIALLRASYGRWFVANREGRCTTLPPEYSEYGEPVGAFWLNEGTALVITASPERGIAYHELHIR
jgi:hypothetical protein